MIPIWVHESSDSAHTSAPDTNTADSIQTPQILKHNIDILSLMKSQWNVLALWNATACEIECE